MFQNPRKVAIKRNKLENVYLSFLLAALIPIMFQKSSLQETMSSFFSLFLERIGEFDRDRQKVFIALDYLVTIKAPFSFYPYLEGALALIAQAEDGFIQTRRVEALAWLIEKFSPLDSFKPGKKSCNLAFYRHEVSYPFSDKKVISICIALRGLLIDIEMIRKIIIDKFPLIIFVNGSFLSTTSHRDNLTKIYFEVHEKEGLFCPEEFAEFQSDLWEAITGFFEKPQVQFIMPSNREQLIKSFRWIMRDLNKNDLPHVYIDFNRQVGDFFQFSALVCQVKNNNVLSLNDVLSHPDIHIEGMNSLNEGGINKEGAILVIDIPIHSSSSIIDARKECYFLLESLIGVFRDVNGGLLEKIEENFIHLSKCMQDSKNDLRSFFYGIFPSEKQATAPLSFLKIMYASILKEQQSDLETNCSITEDKDKFCITIKTPYSKFEKEFRYYLFEHFSEILFTSIPLKEGIITSSVLGKTDLEKMKKFKALAFSFYAKWHEKKDIKQVLRLCCTTKFTLFDPRIGTEEETSHLHKMLFEGLMRISSDGSPEMGVAQKVEIENSGRLYRFFLKESKWSNGYPLTAHDFAYSWKMSLKPESFCPLSYLFYPIVNARRIKEGKAEVSSLGVRVLNDMALEVELDYPTPYFLELCAHSSFSPICRFTDTNNPSWPEGKGNEYICNGPFMPESICKIGGIRMIRNPYYWEQEKVVLEKICILHETEKKASALFKEGKIDVLLYPFCKSQALNPPKNPKYQKIKGATETRYLYFNCSKFPFSNSQLRQAFSLGLNRKALAPLFSGDAVPSYAPFSSKFTQINPNEIDEENPYLAQKFFEKSLNDLGISRSQIENERIYTTSRAEKIARLISKQLNTLFGLKLAPTVLPTSVFYSFISQKRPPLFIYSWINRIQSPSYFLDTFSSLENPLNHSKWFNDKITLLLNEIQQTSNPTLKNKLYAEAEEILHREKPVIPLISAPICSITQPNIKNIYATESQQFDVRFSYKD